jgi:glycosyltransferase involved in cell wall biosynthesis
MNINIEGWRFAYHSFALVNQWQLLSLFKQGDLNFSFTDKPFIYPQWKSVRGVFDSEQERSIEALIPPQGEPPDVTYRIYTPYDFSAAPLGRTVVFATSEFQIMRSSLVQPGVTTQMMREHEDFFIVTPSKWSSECFTRWGLRPEQILVIPHGAATEIFHPDLESREITRKRLGLSGFVFGNFSGMTGNKGVDILLRAFGAVAKQAPEARLLLKGTDEVYPSTSLFSKILDKIPASVRASIEGRLIFTGNAVSMREMADLYRALDAYVSPYRAEGFNLPPLEAAACGIPVICTRGGPTDEFLEPSYAYFIDSEPRSIPSFGELSKCFEPSVESLSCLMLKMMSDDAWRRTASAAGPARVQESFTWDHAAADLRHRAFEARPAS